MSTKTKKTTKKKSKTPASIVWFEIPAEDLGRAKTFYKKLFDWKITAFPGMKDYFHIDTAGADTSLDGGMLPRMHSRHTITNYILVDSVIKAAAKVEKLGGKVCRSKTAVPNMGYFAICRDTEENEFAVWEPDPKAK